MFTSSKLKKKQADQSDAQLKDQQNLHKDSKETFLRTQHFSDPPQDEASV